METKQKRSLRGDKKGQLESLYGYIMTFVLVAILLGVGLIVLDEFTDQTDVGSEAETAVNLTIAALGDFADWFDIIVVVIAAAIVLGIVIRAFRGTGGGGL